MIPEQVAYHNGFCGAGNSRLYLIRGWENGITVAVNEHRLRAGQGKGAQGRLRKKRGKNHLVSRAEADGAVSEVVGGGEGTDREGVLNADKAGDGGFEGFHRFAGRKLVVDKAVKHCLELFSRNSRFVHDDLHATATAFYLYRLSEQVPL